MQMGQQKKVESRVEIHKSAIEGVVIVGGRPQIERADMPLTLSFDSVEDLEWFCRAIRSREQDQH